MISQIVMRFFEIITEELLREIEKSFPMYQCISSPAKCMKAAMTRIFHLLIEIDLLVKSIGKVQQPLSTACTFFT